MKTSKYIRDKVDDVLNSVDAINDVKVSPYFKDKAIQVLFSEKESRPSSWSWMMPKLQLAALLCFIVLNIFALTQINKPSYDEYISEFADLYDLNVSEDNSLLTEAYED